MIDGIRIFKSIRNRIRYKLIGDERGAALIEMALVMPILLAFLLGIISFGSWIALAHTIQQSANEGARAGLAGMTVEERASIAKTAADTALAQASNVNLKKVSVVVQDDGAMLIVRISYEPTGDPLLSMSIVPLPSGPITRQAAVKLQGM